MGKLRKLQEQYLKGEITKAQYEAAVQKLLDDDIIDQEQLDEALDYDPEHERPQYSQADVDAMIAKRAVRMVRKALKDAGVKIDADDKGLLTAVADAIKNGSKAANTGNDDQGNGNAGLTDDEVASLRGQAEKVTVLTERIKDLVVENAVLKEAGKYNPVNPAQVVRAIRSDYMDGIDFDDETGTADVKSVSRVLRKVVEAEPNLFTKTDDQGQQTEGTFKGKGPGGTGGTGKDNVEAKKAEALAMLGIKKDDKK